MPTIGSETYSSALPTETLPKETTPSESVALPESIKGEDWPGPTLDGLNPESIAVPGPDAFIVIHGTNFSEETLVIWNDDEIKPEFVNEGKLRVLTHPAGVTQDLPFSIPVAAMEKGIVSNTLLFTFENAPERTTQKHSPPKEKAKTEEDHKHAKHKRRS